MMRYTKMPQLRFMPPANPECAYFPAGLLAHSSSHYAFVVLDTKRLDNHLKMARARYVGADGGDTEPSKAGKHARAQRIIDAGESMEMPVMHANVFSTDDEFLRAVKVDDGRHRLYRLHTNGIRAASVAVPAFQAGLFTKHFGFDGDAPALDAGGAQA